ncbi:LysR family transcriptional regulator [Burkholderia sp. L27(2015)]|uniref:LysR family transcriptional regulator n=1 Tax=Burkholderia sp. L27(2015) TaxID=1641858 RepID=UPI00131BBBA3|nr:LysR family transcriptional regulator [Burkholderia sp. L27(2015)]
MDTLQNMRVFMRIVEDGSFTAAARHLNATTAYVSRAISDLETHLRTRLLNRTTRRIAMTEAGERYLQRCEQILAYVDEAEAEASDAHARPSGTLRVHAMSSLGQHYVIPAISRYQQVYPEVNVQLTLAPRIPDLFDEGYDVSVVLATDLPDSGLIAQKLGVSYSILCASPDYLERYGTPRTLAELQQHNCLQLVSPVFVPDVWAFQGPGGIENVPITGSFQVNVAESMLVAVREGMGIGSVPVYSAVEGLKSGEFVRVMPQHGLQHLNVYALYASRQYLDAKIKAWIDVLRQTLPAAMQGDEDALARFSAAAPTARASVGVLAEAL